jgi:hypothetical protein
MRSREQQMSQAIPPSLDEGWQRFFDERDEEVALGRGCSRSPDRRFASVGQRPAPSVRHAALRPGVVILLAKAEEVAEEPLCAVEALVASETQKRLGRDMSGGRE